MKAFLATYQSFTTPMELFMKLLERYDVPENIPESLANKVQLRVIIVLKYWIQTQFYDINTELLGMITEFLIYLRESGQISIAQQLENVLETKTDDREESLRRIEAGELPPLDTNQLYLVNPVSSDYVLFAVSVEDIAKHITMQEASIFYSIEVICFRIHYISVN